MQILMRRYYINLLISMINISDLKYHIHLLTSMINISDPNVGLTVQIPYTNEKILYTFSYINDKRRRTYSTDTIY